MSELTSEKLRQSMKVNKCNQLRKKLEEQFVLANSLQELRLFLLTKAEMIPESYRKRVQKVEADFLNYSFATIGIAVAGNVIVFKYLPGWKSLSLMFKSATVLGVICLSGLLMSPLMNQNREERTIIYSEIMQRANQYSLNGYFSTYLK